MRMWMLVFAAIVVLTVIGGAITLVNENQVEAVHNGDDLGASVVQGLSCGLGGGFDRDGQTLTGGRYGTKVTQVTNKHGTRYVCTGLIPGPHPEEAVIQLGATSRRLPADKNIEVADVVFTDSISRPPRACRFRTPGPLKTTNWEQKIDTDGFVQLRCYSP